MIIHSLHIKFCTHLKLTSIRTNVSVSAHVSVRPHVVIVASVDSSLHSAPHATHFISTKFVPSGKTGAQPFDRHCSSILQVGKPATGWSAMFFSGSIMLSIIFQPFLHYKKRT